MPTFYPLVWRARRHGSPVFGLATAPVPFWAQPDAVVAYVKGIQAGVGVPQTGEWNEATHDAFAAYLVAVGTAAGEAVRSVGAWGDNPGAVGATAALLPVQLAQPGVFGLPASNTQAFLAGWGITAATAPELALVLLQNKAGLEQVQPRVMETIVTAESAKCASVSPWLIAVGVGVGSLVLGGLVGWWIGKRKAGG